MGCIQSDPEPPLPPPRTQQGRAPQAALQHINGRPSRPLTAAPMWRSDRPVTAQNINRMRTEFWETRVEGNAQSWAALKVVSETVLQGDIAQANALLEAASISTPAGTLQQCYDDLGRRYAVPDFCLSYPSNLDHGEVPTDIVTRAGTGPDDKSIIALRIRSLNRPDVPLTLPRCATVGEVKRRFLAALAPEQKLPEARVRLFFFGRECMDAERLQDCRVTDGMVVTMLPRR